MKMQVRGRVTVESANAVAYPIEIAAVVNVQIAIDRVTRTDLLTLPKRGTFVRLLPIDEPIPPRLPSDECPPSEGKPRKLPN